MTNYGYTPTTWSNGSTALSATHMTNLEQQFIAALTAWNADISSGAAFLMSGYACTKDGTTANQLDVTSGIAYLIGADSHNDLVRVANGSATYTTSAHTTTYYLDLNPDGTWSFGTAHSVQTNYMPICHLLTDSSGNISTVTQTAFSGLDFMTGIASVIFPNAIQSDGGLFTTDGNGNLGAESIALQRGVKCKGWSQFTGSGSGTVSHGLGTTPTIVLITAQTTAPVAIGADAYASSTVRITAPSIPWVGIAFAF